MNRRSFYKQCIAWSALGMLPGKPLIAPMEDLRPVKKPNRLQVGDTVALIAPGSPIGKKRLETSVSNLSALGLQAIYSESILDEYGYLAGTDTVRMRDIHTYFNDPQVKAIWCVRGGYGTTRLLPYLDYKMIRRHPKILIGYSDITALIQAIYKKTGLIGFHGPMGASTFDDYNINGLKSILMEPKDHVVIPYPSKMQDDTYVIHHGEATGTLIGGNLTLVCSLVGTSFEMCFKNKIVFLEDIGEKPYRLDRMITQLLQTGLNKANAIVLGVFDDCDADPGDHSLSLKEMFKDRLSNLGIPVIYGLPFGHIKNQCTLPIGLKAKISTSKAELSLLESAVL